MYVLPPMITTTETNSTEYASTLRIDIVSDVVCPWCIIGYLQLRKALDQLRQPVNVDLHWQPFELNPNMPPEGQDLREHIAQKYGTPPGQSGGARQRLIDLGAQLGFEFNYADDMRMVNTFQAHQLLHWAAEHKLQTELKLAMFKAFFSDGQDLSNTAVLQSVAASVGLPEAQALAVLEDQRYANDVRVAQQNWLEKDVHAVPAFSFNQQYPLPGAQGEATFLRFLEKVIARSKSD